MKSFKKLKKYLNKKQFLIHKTKKQTLEYNKMEKYSSLLCFTLLLLFSFTNGQDEKSEGKESTITVILL